MSARVMLCLLLAVGLPACQTPYKKADQAEAKEKTDRSGDVAFQSFLGRLRKAVAAKDLPTLRAMMASDFGYRWDAPVEPESIFDYWAKNDLWPELGAVLGAPFSPYSDFMVAPPGFAKDPTGYKGYRAGLHLDHGSWKFAYFVPPEGLQ